MAYTITQARPLLTAAELELFDQSRTEPIKALTLSRLRDKYRDLYRRQTVAMRSAPNSKSRSPVGSDNERTQRKADILQEVLGRFEARVAQLEARDARESAREQGNGAPKGRAKSRSAGTRSTAEAKPKAAAKKAKRQATSTGHAFATAKPSDGR